MYMVELDIRGLYCPVAPVIMTGLNLSVVLCAVFNTNLPYPNKLFFSRLT